MSDPITWREGINLTHAIRDCDQNASAWVTLCGSVISGPENQINKCPECERLLTLSPQTTKQEER